MKRFIVFFLLLFSAAAQCQEYGLGLLLDDALYKNVPKSPKLMRGDYENLPAAVSLKDFAPTPGYQGSYGTCTAWATGYAARTLLESINYRWTKKQADSNAFSPSFIYNQIRTKNSCMEGTSLYDALNVLKDEGGVKLKDFPYECSREVTSKDRDAALQHRIIEYREIADRNTKDKVRFVKKSLSESKAVVIAFDCPPSFNNSGELWEPEKSDYKAWGRGHAMTVVGYDNTKYGGAFELLNSWGTNWANHGFCWLKYSDFEYFCKLAFELIDRVPSDSSAPDLSGSLSFNEISGKEMAMKFNGEYFTTSRPYASGTLFDLRIANNEPAYVYAFGTDLTFETNRIFPAESRMLAYLPYRQNNVAIPDEDSYNELDTVKGKSFYCFLYSRESLDLDKIMLDVKSGTGTLWERISKALENRKITESDIQFSYDGKIVFKAKSKGRQVVPVIVEIDHI